MALVNYGDLKTSLANWLGRSDLTTPIPDFVTLAHKQLMRDLRGHLRLQKRDAAFSITGEYVDAPSDFLELVSIYLNTSPKQEVQFMTNDRITTQFTGSGKPKFVALVGSTATGTEGFRFGPAPDGTYTATIEYYASVTYFSADSGAGSTNWILTDHPSLYLFGSLLAAAAYIGDDPRVPLWKAGYDEALAAVRAEGYRARWGGNAMAVLPA